MVPVEGMVGVWAAGGRAVQLPVWVFGCAADLTRIGVGPLVGFASSLVWVVSNY